MKTKIIWSGLGLILTIGVGFVLHGTSGGSHGHFNPHGGQEDHRDKNFTASHFQKQAQITLNGGIATVWPLFDPINESKWASIWNPELIYPKDGSVHEGMIFRTPGMRDDSAKLVWIVTTYDPKKHNITYTVTNPDRVLRINTQCTESGSSKTMATITYTFVNLTVKGEEINRSFAKHLFRSNMKDWQEAINHFLKTGEVLQHHSQHH